MKKAFTYITIVVIVTSVLVSCNNKNKKSKEENEIVEAKSLKDLKEKYSNYKFENCDEFLAAGDEMLNVYVKTIDKAMNGDSLAKKDLDRFDTFMNQFDILADKFATECPDQFEEWAKKKEILISEAADKLFIIYSSDYSDDVLEYDEEIGKNIDEEVELLNQQVEQILSEDSLLNNIQS